MQQKKCLKTRLALIFVIHFWHYDVIFYPEDIFAFGGGGVGLY